MRKEWLIVLVVIFSLYGQSSNFGVSYDFLSLKDNMILQIANSVSVDTVLAKTQHLVDYETRYYKHENRFQIANWIKHQFEICGISSTEIDSFSITDNTGTYMQYNVIADIQGSDTPDEYLVLNCNYDSCITADEEASMVYAPGANFNATGVAGMIEFARCIDFNNFIPKTSIRFVAMAARCCNESGYSNFLERMVDEQIKIKYIFRIEDLGLNSSIVNTNTICFASFYPNDNEFFTSVINNYLIISTDITSGFTPNQYTDILNIVKLNTYDVYTNTIANTSNDVMSVINEDLLEQATKALTILAVYTSEAPDKVENLDAIVAGDGKSVSLSWDEIDDDYVYRISWKDDLNAYHGYVTENPYYEIQSLNSGNTYDFSVEGISPEGIIGLPLSISVTTSVIPLKVVINAPELENGYANLSWNYDEEEDFLGYNIYHSENENGTFVMINSVPILDKNYTITTNGSFDYYYVTAIDEDDNESVPSDIMKVRSFDLQDKILIVDESNSSGSATPPNPSDEQMDEYYNTLFGYVYGDEVYNYDIDEIGTISLADLSIYKAIYWHDNNESLSEKIGLYADVVVQYMKKGGNVLLSICRPSKSINYVGVNANYYNPHDPLYDFFKTQFSLYSSYARFNKAIGINGYPDIDVDILKTTEQNNFHLKKIETIFSLDDATEIYNYGSDYPSGSNEGELVGMPVGLECFDDETNLVFLTYNLYYMDFEDGKNFLYKVLDEKFGMEVGVKENNPVNFSLSEAYPNPFNPVTTINYQIGSPNDVKFSIYNSNGERVLFDNYKNHPSGSFSFKFNAEKFSSGVYYLNMQVDKFQTTKKLVLIK
ncbi:MAG: T9SS type A sorting domain-containing protein [Candidatus Delongbacteria bacterium]|nr:T9SS type A sorting domain-containing protein [Candidatus Delongbacteria bacterium]MBN2835428.1 T9SS type A sorting domain-containing protein [Candidatus Delongbacteria bacterium]